MSRVVPREPLKYISDDRLEVEFKAISPYRVLSDVDDLLEHVEFVVLYSLRRIGGRLVDQYDKQNWKTIITSWLEYGMKKGLHGGLLVSLKQQSVATYDLCHIQQLEEEEIRVNIIYGHEVVTRTWVYEEPEI